MLLWKWLTNHFLFFFLPKKDEGASESLDPDNLFHFLFLEKRQTNLEEKEHTKTTNTDWLAGSKECILITAGQYMKASWRGAAMRCSLFFHRLSPRPRSAGRGGTGLAFTRVCSLGAGVVGNYGAGGRLNYPINFNFKGWWLKIARLMSGMLFIQYSCTFSFKVVCMDFFFSPLAQHSHIC